MTTMAEHELNKLEVLLFVKFFHAFSECSDQIQGAVREMMSIVNDPNSDEDEREMALVTIADALFPNPHNGELGIELEESERMGAEHSDEMRQVLAEFDKQEATFAERLRGLMASQGISQSELGEKIGVGQSAISMMLNRKCRPQRRTVARLADALGVSVDALWTY